MFNIIIGKRSNLTQQLLSVLDNSLVVSSGDIVKELNTIDWHLHSEVNLILNQFQTARKLDNLDSPINYINNAIGSTAKILEFFKSKSVSINKIIYTSSSSVYGNNKSCHENDTPAPSSLYSTLKLANEKLVVKFCQDMGIDYTIARVFNMYGKGDNFSIISKIITCYKDSQTLNLINNGQSVRDFIHIDDVVNIYRRLLMVQNVPIVNVATGLGESVLSILSHLQENQIIIKASNSVNLNEIYMSVANNSRLLSIIGEYKFINIKESTVNHIK